MSEKTSRSDWVLELLTGADASTFTLSKTHSNIIGRGCADPSTTIHLDIANVSRTHCKIEWRADAEAFVLSDIASRRATRINDECVRGEVVLRPGDRLAQSVLKTLSKEAPVSRSSPNKHRCQ